MPLYAYKCNACEYACKLFHLADEGGGKCPRCNADDFNKQYNSPSIIKLNTSDSAGKRIEKYIEETKESIREQIAEARKDFVK